MEEKKLVSLDVFETAFVMNTMDIYELFKENYDPEFAEKRIEVEKYFMGTGETFTIEEVFDKLEVPNKEEAIKAEVEMFKNNTIVNSGTLELYNDPKLECIFISDTHFHREQLVELLEHHGYKDPVVYTSADCKVQKKDGGLFRYVEKELDRHIDLHCGDNYRVDILGAKEVGIKGYLIPSAYNYKSQHITEENIKNSKLRKLLLIEEMNTGSELKHLAIALAPIVYERVNTLKKVSNNNLLFMNNTHLYQVVAKGVFGLDSKMIETDRVINTVLKYDTLNDDMMYALSTRFKFHSAYGMLEKLGYIGYENKTPNVFFNGPEDILKYLKDNQDFIAEYLMELKQNYLLYLEKEGVDFENSTVVSNIEDYSIDSWALFDSGIALPYLTDIRCYKLRGYNKKGDVIPLSYDLKESNKIGIAEQIRDCVVNICKKIYDAGIEVLEEDTERLAREINNNPKEFWCIYFNSPVYEIDDGLTEENIINYQVLKIENGELEEQYSSSIWRSAFKFLLANNRNLAYLKEFIE